MRLKVEFSSRYELSKKFRGRTEFYEIRQCKDLITDEIKSVKVYRKMELQPDALALVRREVDLLRTCDHPNIIKVFDLFEDDSKIYLVVEDLNGPNLFDFTI